MTNHELNYIQALPQDKKSPITFLGRVKKWPWGFISTVIVPTTVTAIYVFLIVSPRYVSEAQFIVRQPDNRQPTALGMVLQGAGLSSAQSDAFAVHEYMTSRDALRDINRNNVVKQALTYPQADFLSRRNQEQMSSFDNFYKRFQNFITVGYDSTTGISVLRVQAFTPKDAHAINEALLSGGEHLVNRLNTRSNQDAVAQAERSVAEAQMRLNSAQQALTNFRNQEKFIDPETYSRENAALIANLSATIANLQAERDQVAQGAPNSPELPILSARITAFEKQLTEERSKQTGGPNSLAPKIGTYESLTLERQLAAQSLSAASISLESSRQDMRRQHLYLERVVSPNLPDKASQPRRFKMFLTVLLSTLAIYALGWLMAAGVREHRQA